MSGVVALQRTAAIWKGSHDGFVVAEDLQTGEEQRFTLTSWDHHLGEGNLKRSFSPDLRQ